MFLFHPVTACVKGRSAAIKIKLLNLLSPSILSQPCSKIHISAVPGMEITPSYGIQQGESAQQRVHTVAPVTKACKWLYCLKGRTFLPPNDPNKGEKLKQECQERGNCWAIKVNPCNHPAVAHAGRMSQMSSLCITKSLHCTEPLL